MEGSSFPLLGRRMSPLPTLPCYDLSFSSTASLNQPFTSPFPFKREMRCVLQLRE